jgi:hypothetical protein
MMDDDGWMIFIVFYRKNLGAEKLATTWIFYE